MHRRSFLKTSLLCAPAVFTLSSLPARAGATGSTLIEAAGLSASGSVEIPGFGPGGNGLVNMTFTSGPAITAQFGPGAVTRLVNARTSDRFGVLFNGINGAASHQTDWTLDANAAAGARARFRVDGGLEAEASAIIGGDQYQGAGVAAMILAALSAGATLRQAATTRVQALVRPHAAPAGMAFGLAVTVNVT
jgi:hypothetical protein